MNNEKVVRLSILVALALCGLWAVINLVELGPTYDGSDTM